MGKTLLGGGRAPPPRLHHPFGIGYDSSVKTGVPSWAADDRESVRWEAEPYRGMTPEERGAKMAAACRAAAKLLRAREDRAVVLAYRDPLPESTVLALKRLRALSRTAEQKLQNPDRVRP